MVQMKRMQVRGAEWRIQGHVVGGRWGRGTERGPRLHDLGSPHLPPIGLSGGFLTRPSCSSLLARASSCNENLPLLPRNLCENSSPSRARPRVATRGGRGPEHRLGSPVSLRTSKERGFTQSPSRHAVPWPGHPPAVHRRHASLRRPPAISLQPLSQVARHF